MTRSLTKELSTPFEELERVFHLTRELFKTSCLDYSSLLGLDLFYDPKNQSKEEFAEAMTEQNIKIEANGDNFEVKWDPNNIEFKNWLASKFRNHKTMNTLRMLYGIYWRNKNDEEVITDSEIFNHRDDNLIEENEEDKYCNTRDLPGFIREANSICYEDYEWKLLKTLSLDESRSPEFNLFFDLEEYSKEEVAETMTKTMKQYISKTRADYGLGIARPKIDDKDHFELKVQSLKELRDNTFSGLDNEDANEHTEKVFEIVDLFHIPNITQDQVILRAFLMSLSGVASHWLRNKPYGSITTWEDLKTKFLSNYFPPARTAKKIEEINNF
nr:hypothetical protein [Tanacetum cinerariifolium]